MVVAVPEVVDNHLDELDYVGLDDLPEDFEECLNQIESSQLLALVLLFLGAGNDLLDNLQPIDTLDTEALDQADQQVRISSFVID